MLVQPSYFESFSLALCEGWTMRLPAMVQGRCAVLAGQSARSGGGLAYRGFAEFSETLSVLLARPELRAQMGERGRQYVLQNYEWPTVIAHYEDFVGRVVERSRFHNRRTAVGRVTP